MRPGGASPGLLDDPLLETRRRHGLAEAAAGATAARARRLSDARLVVFAVGLVFSLWIMKAQPQAWGWLGLPVVAFVGLVLAHGRARRAATLAAATRDVQAASLRRQTGAWEGHGPTGEGLLAPEPPPLYAVDLNLFGDGSLFQLVATAGSPLGLRVLASWLSHPTDAATVAARQAAVGELRLALDLREQLAVRGSLVAEDLDRQSLLDWAADRSPAPGARLRPLIDALSLLGAAALGGWLAGWWPFFPLGLVLIADMALLGLCWRRLAASRAGLERAAPALAALASLLEVLERAPCAAPRLQQLQAAVTPGGERASVHLQRLAWQCERLAACQRNPFFAPFALLLHLHLRTAAALTAWRMRHGVTLAGWLDALGEYEALAALGGHAYEHPTHVFPRVHEGAACFRARALGHVLLPAARCVPNDLLLDDEHRLLLLSGSNMSGKSTLLRAVGVNLALALAGATVRAAALECTPLVLATSMRLVDSLRDGTSHFMAEAQRLARIDALTRGDRPVLYLLDEILHGTNSSDRRVGAGAVIRRLFERGALGVVTTHDLALAAIADELAPRAANAHLREGFEAGRMTFDYTLRPGVVTHGNALDLMRSLGLDV